MMRLLNKMAICLMTGMVAAVVGCGSSGQVSVQGRVTFDGQPVGPGSIVFLPETQVRRHKNRRSRSKTASTRSDPNAAPRPATFGWKSVGRKKRADRCLPPIRGS